MTDLSIEQTKFLQHLVYLADADIYYTCYLAHIKLILKEMKYTAVDKMYINDTVIPEYNVYLENKVIG